MPKPALVDTDEHLDEVVEHLDVIGASWTEKMQ
jgi:hypothetical protein